MNNNVRLKLTPEEAYRQVKGEDYNPIRKYIEITASGETLDGVDAILPSIRYNRKH